MNIVSARLGGHRPAAPVRWVPIAMAGLAVAGQLVYPRTSGTAQDALTILTVVLFSGASLSHAWIQRGWRQALVIGGVFAGGGLAVEILGTATGFPFGTYTYSDRIGPMVADVPLLIALAWVMIGYPALVLARLITANRWLGVGIAAGALAAWDLYLDPQMVAEGYWTWAGEGPNLIGTIPVTNYLGWVGTSLVMMTALWPLTARWSPAVHDDRVPVAVYLWTWLGSLVAHLLYFDLPQSALYGGIGMGLFTGLLCVVALRAPAKGQVHLEGSREGATP